MTTLLNFMNYQSPLGLDDRFRDDRGNLITAEEALREEFHKLCRALRPLNPDQSPIIFTADSYDVPFSHLVQTEQQDKFAEQVREQIRKQTPHAKICNMRHYITAQGSHWHAMFAQLDEKGELLKITLTDSSSYEKRGITAYPDSQSNPFLLENKAKIKEDNLGPQQPHERPICWMYALANLAALATSGDVYNRPISNNFANDLLKLINQPNSAKQETVDKIGKEENNLRKNSPVFFPSSIQTNTAEEKKEPLRIIPATNKRPSPHEDENIPLIIKPQSSDNKGCSSAKTIGGSLLLLGAATAAAGGIVLGLALPISLPVGISLLVISLILLVVGALMLIGSCLNNQVEEEATANCSLS